MKKDKGSLMKSAHAFLKRRHSIEKIRSRQVDALAGATEERLMGVEGELAELKASHEALSASFEELREALEARVDWTPTPLEKMRKYGRIGEKR